MREMFLAWPVKKPPTGESCMPMYINIFILTLIQLSSKCPDVFCATSFCDYLFISNVNQKQQTKKKPKTFNKQVD